MVLWWWARHSPIVIYLTSVCFLSFSLKGLLHELSYSVVLVKPQQILCLNNQIIFFSLLIFVFVKFFKGPVMLFGQSLLNKVLNEVMTLVITKM